MGRAEDLFGRLESQGLAAIDEMFAARQNEEAFLEFKTSNGNGKGNKLDDKDRSNLAKVLSGFANSDGGLVIWGIGTGRGGGGNDGASERRPVEDCQRFSAWIDGAVSGLTLPGVFGVRSIPILESNELSKGYVATLIPASLAGPHQERGTGAYYARVGSNFQPVSHSLLAGMFGRRPQPSVNVTYMVQEGFAKYKEGPVLECNVGVILNNPTGVIAREPYVSWNAHSLSRTKSKFEPFNPEGSFNERWQLSAPVDSRVGSCLAYEKFRLAPFSHQMPLFFHLELRPAMFSDAEITITCGCVDAAPFQDLWRVYFDQVSAICTRVNAPHRREDIPAEDIRKILGIDKSRLSWGKTR